MITDLEYKDMKTELEDLRSKNKQLENMLSELLNRAGYPDIEDNQPKTFDECETDEQIKWLIGKGRDINEFITSDPNEKNLKPIHKAKDNLIKLSLLVSNGADINGKTYNEGETVLHICARDNCVDSCHMLIAIGADVNSKDYRGTTPLFNAIDNPEILRILLAANADINAVNYDGLTPFLLAVITNNIGACYYLAEHGADINVRHIGGITPLIYAVCKKYTDIVKMLIEKGADINTPSDKGYKPIQYCEDADIRKLLINAGANI